MRVADLGETAAWLREYDMEAQLLDQLQALQGRIAAVTGGGVFSGGRVLVLRWGEAGGLVARGSWAYCIWVCVF
jgi:hypothetical protein